MNQQQKNLIDTIDRAHVTLMNQIEAVRSQVSLLQYLHNRPEGFQGTPEEFDDYKNELLAYLSREVNHLNTLSHPLVALRARVSEHKYVEKQEV